MSTAPTSCRLLLLSALVLGLSPGRALAQDEYQLAEDDTWVQVEGVDPETPEGQLALARRFLAQGRYDRARSNIDRWIKQHPNHPMMPEAYLIRGDAKLGAGDHYKALFDYEAIARLYPASEVFITALQRELEIAKLFARGKKRKLWGLRIVSAKDEAEELFIRVQERLPGSTLAEEAGMELGDFYFRSRKMDLAAEAYDLFLENYPRSNLSTKARVRLIAAHLASFKGDEFDAAGLHAAREALRIMQMTEPAAAEDIAADALIAGIDEKDARKMLFTARWYLKRSDPVAAEFTIRRLVGKYERTAAAADALRLIPEILPQLADGLRERVAPFYATKRRAILRIEDAEAIEGSAPAPAQGAPDEGE